MTRIISTWLLALVAIPAAVAQDTNIGSVDKSVYNILNPVPAGLMRELTPDRPDKTESPYTVDAGHFQLEMDFANYTLTDAGGVSVNAWNVAPINFKVGLLNNVDVQLVYDNYLNVRTRDDLTGMSVRQSGFGDLTARLKINLWGNDGGTTAFGLLPFVKFPVNTDQLGNNAVEGGIILPLAIKLPYDFDLGLETAAVVLQNDHDGDYHAEIINSITLDHAHHRQTAADGYLEFFSDISTERQADWVGTVDFGLEYMLTENIQIDCGCNFGVTRAADDYNPFAGITVRF